MHFDNELLTLKTFSIINFMTIKNFCHAQNCQNCFDLFN